MNIRLLHNLSGLLSIVVGAVASLCIYRIQWMYYGVALAILGFIFAGINIFLNEKYFAEEDAWPKGYIGMFLSSLPVIFMMLIIFKFKK